MKPKLMIATVVAALGGLLFGFDTAVISGTTHWLKEVYSLNSFWLGFTVSSALIGTIIGALFVGKPADSMGRRKVLFYVAAFYTISAIGTALAWNWTSFFIFRLLGGLGVGGASVVAPMYIAEIAPAKLRGRLVAVTQFNIVFGILVAFFSNYVIASMNLGAVEWRWMFGVETIPAVAFFLLLFKNPLSPRWLVAKGRADEAKKVLAMFADDEASVDTELQDIQASLDLEHHSLKEKLFQKKYSKPIFLAIAIAMFNQMSGINAIMYYAPHIFKMAGSGTNSALLQTIAIGIVNIIFTMAALAIIDFFGRKKLMLVGSIGYIISLGTIAITFYANGTEFTKFGGTVVLISLMVFVASHAFGQGAVIWVFLGEIFPNRVRARGQSMGSATHWIMAALISTTFPMIAAKSGAHIFSFYAICMVGQLLWVILVMPETKGISLEQIQKKLGIE